MQISSCSLAALLLYTLGGQSSWAPCAYLATTVAVTRTEAQPHGLGEQKENQMGVGLLSSRGSSPWWVSHWSIFHQHLLLGPSWGAAGGASQAGPSLVRQHCPCSLAPLGFPGDLGAPRAHTHTHCPLRLWALSLRQVTEPAGPTTVSCPLTLGCS